MDDPTPRQCIWFLVFLVCLGLGQALVNGY